MTQTLTVWNTKNMKTGPCALSTYRTQDSCPTTCAFFHNGCYAENGPFAPFKHAARGEYGLDRLSQEIRRLLPNDVVRLNVSGDYLTDHETPDLAYILVTNAIPVGVTVISYTHAWEKLDPGMFAPHTRPNASCDTEQDVERALAAGWSVVTVDHTGKTIAGRAAVTCLFETKKIQCVECKLCARTNRPSVVVFNAHGTKKNAAKRSLTVLRQEVAA